MITTLILSAGSINGIMFVGAYKTLFGQGYLASVKTIIGCSVGSVIGLMIALKYTPQEMHDTCQEVLVDEGLPSIGLCNIMNMWNNGGLVDSTCMKQYIRKVLLKKHDQPDITFADLAKKTGVEFIVCGSNITKGTAEYFSFIHTPRMSILEAISISCCIPVLFRPVKYNGNYYLDGAVYNYLPIDIAKDKPDNVMALWLVWKKHDKPTTNFLKVCESIICGLTSHVTLQKVTPNTCSFEPTIQDIGFKLTFFNSGKRKISKEIFEKIVKQGHDIMSEWLQRDYVSQREHTSRGKQVTTDDAQFASPSQVAG